MSGINRKFARQLKKCDVEYISCTTQCQIIYRGGRNNYLHIFFDSCNTSTEGMWAVRIKGTLKLDNRAHSQTVKTEWKYRMIFSRFLAEVVGSGPVFAHMSQSNSMYRVHTPLTGPHDCQKIDVNRIKPIDHQKLVLYHLLGYKYGK